MNAGPAQTRGASPTLRQWVVNDDPDTGRPLEVVHADNPDLRICFLASDGKRSTARLIAAAPDLAVCLAALIETFHARPDILRLCGFHEQAQIKAACNALNRAGVARKYLPAEVSG